MLNKVQWSCVLRFGNGFNMVIIKFTARSAQQKIIT